MMVFARKLRLVVPILLLLVVVAWAEEDACGQFPEAVLAGSNTIACEWGCYDMEDEACHEGLTKNQCAEIYGHVAWVQFCNCGIGSGEADPKATEEVNLYFSVPAFVVLFRESLEVVIVFVIVVQFLTKVKDDGAITEELYKRLVREVYIGAGVGFICCLILGIGLLALASLARGLFKCDSLLVFDGVIMMTTSVVLTFLALNLYKMLYTKEAHELQAGELEASFGRKHAFLIFSFTTGLCEGMESIIFLIGVFSDIKDPSYVSSLPIPIITALILSRIVGCIFFQGTKKMRVEHFMRFCSALLLFIAAGFFASSMHKWQELDLVGTWSPARERPWLNQKVFDASDCCSDKTNRFFVLMRALLGYQDQPTPFELFAYLFYWLVAVAAGVVLVRRAKRAVAARLEDLRKAAADTTADAEATENQA
eukprot:CAMPEP_0204122604 /NCGR_PEP_ID=MMETSP0361-20130328/8815_1 /ASSEMBLY_ACC=CAM_ASM_000343 /TAXON_ID=268821 /ORGANISM="Scrippsiella Hangoei, Strain SHTV-5" /LENGTH=423 /DNA_ID=CAMNT_0051073953 /DNA_START=43 /DNA_END=1314 /DNA_ORIENTATION=-